MTTTLDQGSVIDIPPSRRFPVYTRANWAEIAPGPATPFNMTTGSSMAVERAWRRALVRFGAFDEDEFDPDHQELYGVFYGYGYLNVSVQRVFGARMPGASPSLVDQAFFGSTDGVPPYEEDPRDPSEEHAQRILRTVEWLLTIDGLPELDETRAEILRWKVARPDFAAMTDRELFDYARPFIEHRYVAAMEQHFFVLTASTVPVGLVTELAAAAGRPDLGMRLLGGLGAVDSAAPLHALWDAGRTVAGSSALMELFDGGTDELLDRVAGSPAPDAAGFLSQFADVVFQHGWFCTLSWDASQLSWDTDPRLPLTAIERMRFQSDEADPRSTQQRLERDREKALGELVDALANDSAAQAKLRAGVASAAVLMRARERSKSNTVMLVNEARIPLQLMANRWMAAGHLDRIDDFTMLKLDEFDTCVDDPARYATLIRERRTSFDELAGLQEPFITVGLPALPSTWPAKETRPVTQAVAGEVIVGLSGCPGVVTGRARIVLQPEDAADLQPDEIMIAPQTDPGWTPLFMSAKAVVVDIGAPLSHAAILSRELGIPCVLSATDATRRIREGAIVTVDGGAGTVTVQGP